MGDTAAEPCYQIVCEEVKTGDVATFTPGKLQKVVHLVRHGQATHNVYAVGKIQEGEKCPCITGKPNCPYLSPLHEDANLTQKGRLQATTIAPKIIQTKPIPQLVFVSPLRRTLQTATIGFATLAHFQIPLIADETLRERMGLHLCDKRSDVERICKLFQNVDLSHIPPGPDDNFSTVYRETEEETAERGKQFFLQLKDRTEQSFAIVSHSSFLYNTLSKALITPDENGKSESSFPPPVTFISMCVLR